MAKNGNSEDIRWCREALEEAALDYARLKAFGIWIDERGERVQFSKNDSEEMQIMKLEDMRREASRLLGLLEAPLPERKK